jgi:hypothetical protein
MLMEITVFSIKSKLDHVLGIDKLANDVYDRLKLRLDDGILPEGVFEEEVDSAVEYFRLDFRYRNNLSDTK